MTISANHITLGNLSNNCFKCVHKDSSTDAKFLDTPNVVEVHYMRRILDSTVRTGLVFVGVY